MLKFRSEKSEPEFESVLQRAEQALLALPETVSEIVEYRVIKDLGVFENNAQLMLEAVFNNEAEFKSYVFNAEHQQVMKEYLLPHLEAFQSIQVPS